MHAAAQEERAERESEAWAYLDAPSAILAPAAGFDECSTAGAPDALTWEIGPRHAPVDLRRWLGLELAPSSKAQGCS